MHLNRNNDNNNDLINCDTSNISGVNTQHHLCYCPEWKLEDALLPASGQTGGVGGEVVFTGGRGGARHCATR